MRRPLGLIILELVAGIILSSPIASGQDSPPQPWADSDRDLLRRHARATWHSFEAMTPADGLPADRLDRVDGDTWKPSKQTSPTDIASYLWATLAAEKLAIIDPDDARHRLGATLATLKGLEREHGFFFNLYDVESRRRIGDGGSKDHPARPFLSTVDNGWLAASLTMVRNTCPTLRDAADDLLAPMNFGFFYEPFDSGYPVQHPGQFHGGYYTDDHTFSAFYGMLNTEPRIVSYLAITRGQVPPEHYFRLYRTLPRDRGRQWQTPVGDWRTYRGVPVFEGHYDVRGRAIVPSWGGSMFEALMVPLFVPEARWAPASWGINHPLYVQAQIEQGLQERHYATWGFSPCRTPEGGYQTYGVEDLGSEPQGYRTFELRKQHQPAQADSPPSIAGVVTPHASFLALAFAPTEALSNLRHLETTYPIFGSHGFADSVNVATGQVSPCILSLDQGMILAAIANALTLDALQHALTDGPIEAAIRPIIAPEKFTAHPRDP